MKFINLIHSEFLKLRRCPIVWISLAAFAMGPVVITAFFGVVQDPDLVRKLGLFGQKALVALDSRATGIGFADMMEEVLYVAGLLVMSVIMAFTFGREYAEGTAKNLLVLPVSRQHIILAKLLVASLWFAAEALLVWIVGLACAAGLGFADWTPALAATASVKAAWTVLLILALGPLVALVALISRGYFAALGYTMLSVILAMLLGTTNWSPWFPWSIIPVWAGLTGPDSPPIGNCSMAIMAATFLVGTSACIFWLRRADNSQ